MTKDINYRLNRITATFDAYAGLRKIGYTRLGAIRALRTLGLSFAEARAADLDYEGEVAAPKPADCPSCGKVAVLSDASEGGMTFSEAICDDCRNNAKREFEMDAFDHAYEAACANGWAD